MSLRTVRLDEAAEKILDEYQQETGLSMSAAMKKAIQLLGKSLPKTKRTAYEIYQTLDLGTGNKTAPKARMARQEIAKLIKQKHHR